MKDVIVTTSGRPNDSIIREAEKIAKELNIPYKSRNKQSVDGMIAKHKASVIVVGKERITAQALQEQDPFFFHPNAAMFRAKRWMKTKEDPLVQACNLKEGDSFLDATMGLASDAIIASLATGPNGEVIGIEESEMIAFIVKSGLSNYESNVSEIDEALRRIRVYSHSNLEWLRKAETDSMDVVYFDPMFEEEVSGSNGFDPMRPFTVKSSFTEEVLEEAKRVAKKRVVLKDHFRSDRFQKFGFSVQVRPSATYHFGTIEMEGSN
ncbi:hypothetical protein J2S74_000998 [Evansella vedderi]|uniref:SAM-dependent methyltransferase n=1 Tax=Evansella vedderi TaxID=38282 RepID=A0ABT9ZQW2_9BACI|nr:class I SAM-dependent methyltransferase [Evansella vedderi]MDQ0253626.1 hypothetical protein [Evansella vedderi]